MIKTCHIFFLFLYFGFGESTFGKTDVLQNLFNMTGNMNLANLKKENNTANKSEFFTTTIILRDETKNKSLPSKAHGYVLLDENYEKLTPAKNSDDDNTEVAVGMTIDGITRIDSKNMVVGLEIKVTLVWEDNRIKWPKGSPRFGESFLLDPAVLK